MVKIRDQDGLCSQPAARNIKGRRKDEGRNFLRFAFFEVLKKLIADYNFFFTITVHKTLFGR